MLLQPWKVVENFKCTRIFNFEPQKVLKILKKQFQSHAEAGLSRAPEAIIDNIHACTRGPVLVGIQAYSNDTDSYIIDHKWSSDLREMIPRL